MGQHEQRTVVITGSTGGIGFQSAIGVAKTGARVIVTGRNRERGEQAVRRLVEASGNDAIELVIGDVSSIEGVDALADAVLERTSRIDVLVNNAGYMGSEPRTSADGVEMHFAVNVLAPWRLTHALLPALRVAPAARVVNVVSAGMFTTKLHLPTIAKGLPKAAAAAGAEAGAGDYSGIELYAQHHRARVMLTDKFAEQWKDLGITVNSCHPG